MASSQDVFGSGTTTVKSDTKRILWAKAVRVKGGTPLKSDTTRLLRAKLDKAFKGSASNNSGV